MGLSESKQSSSRSGYPGLYSSDPRDDYPRNYNGSQNRNRPIEGGQSHRNQYQHQQQKQQQLRQGKPQQKQLQNQPKNQQQFKKQQQHKKQQQQQDQQILAQHNRNTEECFVCGHEGHNGFRCFHRNMTCHICKEPGHLASVCKEKMHHAESIYKPKTKPTKNPTHRNSKIWGVASLTFIGTIGTNLQTLSLYFLLELCE